MIIGCLLDGKNVSEKATVSIFFTILVPLWGENFCPFGRLDRILMQNFLLQHFNSCIQ